MHERLTENAYRNEIQSLAEEALAACRTGEITGHDDLVQWVFETVDGHQWVTYTRYHWDVLANSANDGAYVENFGAEGIADGDALNTAALAFAAMEADLWDALHRHSACDVFGGSASTRAVE